MTVSHSFGVGATGHLLINDDTDDPDRMTVEVLLKSDSPVFIHQLPWTVALNGIMALWRSYSLKAVTTPQQLGVFRPEPPNPEEAAYFTVYLGVTNTVEIGGPHDRTIKLAGFGPSESLVDVRHEGVYKKATPYVRHNGVWKTAEPFVRHNGVWKPVV